MKIIPQPNSVELKKGVFTFSASTEIICENQTIKEELNFLDYKKAEQKNAVRFEKADVKEDYIIEIGDDVVVKSASGEGLFHGAMTLKQLIFEYYKDEYSFIPCCIIKDSPRFEYRGYMLDVSRHFFGVETIKKIIDVMAWMKMNKFHWHLSDNQGFRLSIDAYPLLSQIGSKRKGTRGDKRPVEGFYTKDDVRDIVEYARKRYVEVIPEIDLPGHTIAILAAYPSLGCNGKKVEVAEYFGIFDEILCAGKDETYQFVYKMLDEICETFDSKYLHIGGDEVPKSQWENCDDCKKKVEQNHLRDMEDLQGYFTNKVVNYLKGKGKVPIVWNEALNSGTLADGVTVQYWMDGKGAKTVRAALEGGRDTIVSDFFHYYLDYPYGMTPLKKTYAYEPAFETLSQKAKEHVIGVECPLWSEWVADEDKIWFLSFPRALAVAESGWSRKQDKNYADFADRLDNALGLLLAHDIGFATVKESNPNLLKSAGQVIAFFANTLDKHAVESGKNSRKSQAVKRNK